MKHYSGISRELRKQLLTIKILNFDGCYTTNNNNLLFELIISKQLGMKQIFQIICNNFIGGHGDTARAEEINFAKISFRKSASSTSFWS